MITIIEAAIECYGVPNHIRSDNGPEFIAYVVNRIGRWAVAPRAVAPRTNLAVMVAEDRKKRDGREKFRVGIDKRFERIGLVNEIHDVIAGRDEEIGILLNN